MPCPHNEISIVQRSHRQSAVAAAAYEYFSPIIKMLPQKAFYSRCRVVGIRDSVNSISSSFVMCYPPGIPLLAPGELITRSIAEHITYAQAGRCDIVGLAPDGDIFIVDE